jgi:rRNA processing protein Gar1
MQSRDKIKSIYGDMSGEQRLKAILNCLGNDHDLDEISDIASSFDIDWNDEKVVNKKNFITLVERNNFLYFALFGMMSDSMFFQIQLCIVRIENCSLRLASIKPTEEEKGKIIEVFGEIKELYYTLRHLKEVALKTEKVDWSFLPKGFIENWRKKLYN